MIDPYTKDERVIAVVAQTVQEYTPRIMPLLANATPGTLALIQLAFLAGITFKSKTVAVDLERAA